MNPMDMLKNLNNLQSQFKDIQEKLKHIRAAGTAGGGMVEIEMNGAMEIERVTIAPEAVDPEDTEMLQDLIKAAFNAASANIRSKLQTEASGLAGGMGGFGGGMPGFPGMGTD